MNLCRYNQKINFFQLVDYLAMKINWKQNGEINKYSIHVAYLNLSFFNHNNNNKIINLR